MPRQQTLAAPHGGRHETLSDNQGLDNLPRRTFPEDNQ